MATGRGVSTEVEEQADFFAKGGASGMLRREEERISGAPR